MKKDMAIQAKIFFFKIKTIKLKRKIKSIIKNIKPIFLSLTLLSLTVLSSPQPTLAAPYASISITPLMASPAVGTTSQMEALAVDATGWPIATQPIFDWSSSDAMVATIDATGILTAVSLGTATITASDPATGMSGTMAITISGVDIPVLTTIDITQIPFNNTLQIGQGWGLKADALDETGSIFSPQPTFFWSTSNNNIMTVTPYPNDISTAYIKAISPGTAIITVSGGGISGTVTMIAENKPACGNSISVSPESASIIIGGTQQLKATVIDQYGAPMPNAAIYWMNSAPRVAGTDSNGLVTGITPGQTIINPFANGCNGVIYGTTAAITVLPIPGTFSITASAGANGSVSPTGYTSVVSGGSQTYIITPNTGFFISGLSVDGISAATTTSYTFNNVAANHAIAASFSAIPLATYALTSSAGANGAISPLGATIVNSGANQTYTITPNAGFSIADVIIDGTSAGPVAAYTFNNVMAAHSISASFTATPVVLSNLVTGWNLIGWINVSTTAEAFGLANSGVDMISRWDAATQQWDSHIINFPLNNFTINMGDGIFVHKN